MNQVVVKQEKSGYQIVEAYKSLRTNLQFCGEDKKVIAITSCTPNEGKSSVSMQLGISLAEIGKRVILIDADLRKSVLLGRTKTEKSVRGLAHFLSGQASLEDVICATNIKNFYMIYSGPFPPNPAELLGGKNFRSLLNALRKVYDYVIVDTPPLGSVIDSAIVAEICDGSIMVIESGVISYRFAQEVKSQLEKSNCPLLGVVLNKVDMQKQAYGKYGKYGQYKYYGEYGPGGGRLTAMKKGIVAGLIVLCVALGAGTAAVVVTDDRKGPEIELPADGDVTYEEGSDTAPLLEGVTATDEKDGDVTDSLMIENIFPNDDHTSASVVYAAKDSHNNVSKATRRVNYKAAAEDTPAENEATQGTDNSGAADESAPAAEEPQQNDTEGTKNETDAQMEIEALPAESPKLYLNTYEVTVEAGNDLDKTSYIKEMTDDADSQESLFNQIEIDGDVDTAVPGDYTLTYHVTDSDGNRSNAAVLTVHVQ